MSIRVSLRARSLAAISIIVICVGVQGRAGVVFTNLYSFNGGSDGANPSAKLIQGPDNSFYGTASYGGSFGDGVIFKISPEGSFSNLFTFNGTNGAHPKGALILGKNGKYFYGTTTSSLPGHGGTAFRISPTGVFTNIAKFYLYQGSPQAALLQDTNGNFFGTTPDAGNAGSVYNGSVFEIDTNYTLKTLIYFTEATGDGRGPGPHSALIRGHDGSYYGTSMYGGTNGTPSTYAFEDGMVFKISAQGKETVFASFNGANGAFPVAALTLGKDGNFYGTTSGGGAQGWGTVFQLTTNGNINSLHVFSGSSDGGNPQSDLVEGNDGNFYGTTYEGGANTYGVIYQISTNGSFTTLYTFPGGVDGGAPVGGLLRGNDGNFYGTTFYGGQYGNGIIFRVSIAPSSPTRLSIAQQQPGQLDLSWHAEAGITYQPQSSSDPSSTNWQNLNGPISTNNDGFLSIKATISKADTFYRVTTLPP